MSSSISISNGIGEEVETVPVTISYGIIPLFSDGLYRSPNKAIEELVSNSYDANSTEVRILLPEKTNGQEFPIDPLWVIDNGDGMDREGFHKLWRVAESDKAKSPNTGRRPPIGQFGIGKLAAYVLARNFICLSKVNGKYLLIEMNYGNVEASDKFAHDNLIELPLRNITKNEAKHFLDNIKNRDPDAWQLLFGDDVRNNSWTVVRMSDYKDLYKNLREGQLRWVLSTGLPLKSRFTIYLNNIEVISSKKSLKEIKKIKISKRLQGIGKVDGEAIIYEKELSGGKSAILDWGRSNGFFIRVRGRVINMEDSLFGISQPNHAAWSRFFLDVRADGLREYLLSSREGVRSCSEVIEFRKFLKDTFDECRNAYEKWNEKSNINIDLANLLSDDANVELVDQLIRSVRSTIRANQDSFYIKNPQNIDEDDRSEWLEDYRSSIAESPISNTKFQKGGSSAPLLNYDPESKVLIINKEHPFIDKITNGGKHPNSAKLFALSELLLEGQLEELGIDTVTIDSIARHRDRTLRLAAGEGPLTIHQALRQLNVANEDPTAVERATGMAFQVLGFKYERKGGNASGADGILDAYLGRHEKELGNYRLVYDAKQSSQNRISADKIDFPSLQGFGDRESANYGFFIASSYEGEGDANSKLNTKHENYKTNPKALPICLLKIEHLERLIYLHCQYGVTLSRLRKLFRESSNVSRMDGLIDELNNELETEDPIPLGELLKELEEMKSDTVAIPNVAVARSHNDKLKPFEVERLTAVLQAVESIIGTKWISVNKDSRDVHMHHSAQQIFVEFNRALENLSSGELDSLC